MNKRQLVFVGVALLAAAGLAFKISRAESAKEVEAEAAVHRVLTPTILASGSLTYESQVTLVSEIVGRVQEVLVEDGDQVKRGQVLLRLDPEASLAELAQLEANRRQAALNIQRQQVRRESTLAKWRRYEALRAQGMVEAIKFDELVTEKDVAEVELQTSREALRQAEAELQQARERHAKTVIRAPMDGKVTAVYVKAGETAVPSAASIAGSSLMVIGDTGSLYAEVNIDESDIAKIAVGQQARIVPAAFPDKSLSGKVDRIALAPRQNGQQGAPAQGVSGQSKNYPVKVRLEAAAGSLFHPGMSCRAEISTAAANGQKRLAVPVQAVVYEHSGGDESQAKASVLVMKEGRASKRPVETGVADDLHIEVVKGLAEGEQVIVGPAKTLRFLRDGERVASRSAPAPAPAPAASQAEPKEPARS